MVRAGLLALVLLLNPLNGALAQHPPIAGVDYQVLKSPQATGAPGKIEVIEFFWYRCPHCHSIEPLLESWLTRLPADVRFRRVPVVFGAEWAADARVFYALEAIGEFERLHRRLLDAIHDGDGRKLKGAAYVRWISDWLAGEGVDRRRFDAALSSKSVAATVREAERLTETYGINGTPNFAVQGCYVIRPLSGNRQRVFDITNHLIHKARKAQLARSDP